jgi:hypothetical protein
MIRFDDYFNATIADYDVNRKLHLCNYDAGDSQWHDLTRKRLVVVSRPLPTTGSEPKSAAATSTSRTEKEEPPDAVANNGLPEGIKMPPSIFGVRPNSKGANRPHSSSSKKQPIMSKEEANELLKNSPYLTSSTMMDLPPPSSSVVQGNKTPRRTSSSGGVTSTTMKENTTPQKD